MRMSPIWCARFVRKHGGIARLGTLQVIVDLVVTLTIAAVGIAAVGTADTAVLGIVVVGIAAVGIEAVGSTVDSIDSIDSTTCSSSWSTL